MARLFTPFQQFFDDNGQPLDSGTLQFFLNEVFSEQLDTYSDPSLNNPNPNPVVLNADGRLPFDVWGDGVYSVQLKDKNGVLINTLNTVGGDVGSRTAFSDWSQTIVYGIPAFVVGSDGLYYRSLANNNLGNDPTLNPGSNTFWEEFKLRGVWNNSIIYDIGDVVQSTAGNLWKSVTQQSANDPESDGGTNWLPAIDGEKIPEIIALTWINKSGNFTAVANESYQIDGSSVTSDISLPVLSEGNPFTFHNETISTNKVQILNPSYTIKGPAGDVPAGTDLELEPGNSVQLVAKSISVLEIVGAQL